MSARDADRCSGHEKYNEQDINFVLKLCVLWVLSISVGEWMVSADELLDTDEDMDHDDGEDDEFDDCGEDDCDVDDSSIDREEVERCRRTGEIEAPVDIPWPQKSISVDPESSQSVESTRDAELKLVSPSSSLSASSPPQRAKDGEDDDDVNKPGSDADLEVGPMYLTRLLPVFCDIAQSSIYASVRYVTHARF